MIFSLKLLFYKSSQIICTCFMSSSLREPAEHFPNFFSSLYRLEVICPELRAQRETYFYKIKSFECKYGWEEVAPGRILFYFHALSSSTFSSSLGLHLTCLCRGRWWTIPCSHATSLKVENISGTRQSIYTSLFVQETEIKMSGIRLEISF